MRIDKSKLKIEMANNLGAELEDRKEAAQRLERQLEGGIVALDKAAKNVAALVDLLQKDLNDGNLKPEKIDSPEAMHDFAQRWLTRCLGVIESQRSHEKLTMLRAGGMIQAFQDAMRIPKKIIDQESEKLEAVERGIKEGTLRITKSGSIEEVEKPEEESAEENKKTKRRPVARITGTRPKKDLPRSRKKK